MTLISKDSVLDILNEYINDNEKTLDRIRSEKWENLTAKWDLMQIYRSRIDAVRDVKESIISIGECSI